MTAAHTSDHPGHEVAPGLEARRRPRIPGRPDARLHSVLSREYSGFTAATEPCRITLPASLSVPLVMKLADSPRRPPQFTTGAHPTAIVIDGACAPSYLEVWLAPLGAYTLLDLPIERIASEIVDLADVFGAEGRRLGEEVREAATWQHRFELIDVFLLRRLQSGSEPSPQVARAWQRLVSSGGNARITDVAGEVGWSHRYLIARFRQQIGVTPKAAARLVRFRQVQRRLEAAAPVRWGELAAESGYADQSHLIRDFRTFTGVTPVEYLASSSVT